MKEVIFLFFDLLTTLAKLLQPGGSRAVIAENLLLKQQLIIHNRSRQRAPNLTTQDRALLGFWTLTLNPMRSARSAIIIKPSTLLRFHNALKKRKYLLLHSPRGGRKPGPKGPPKEVIDSIVEMKHLNTRFGCPRIAQQINLAFGLNLDKDTVRRRILAVHCELILPKSHWTATELEKQLREYRAYYNEQRCHSSKDGRTPVDSSFSKAVEINNYRWKKHCRGLFQLPVAA